jgi:tetratricopeptide (TPR) repeat protein
VARQSLWHRLRRARLAQVLLVYTGAAWIVLQITQLLTDALQLPAWVLPVTVILLLIGAVVVGATAWVQSLPSTTEREAAGAVPSDWEIAPREALSSLLRGRMPHLTWARALAGGVAALALLFAGAGVYIGVVRPAPAPSEATTRQPADAIAVLPFEVRGSGAELWREGMMDLLANGLDGIGGLRTIDPRTVMARWRTDVGADSAADLATALRVAAGTGARYALSGSVVALGESVRLVANVYDVDTGDEIAQARAEGPSSDLFRLSDELVVQTTRHLLSSKNQRTAGRSTADQLTTTSVRALRAFLEAEAHYRHGRFQDAVARYEEAVAEDSTFAIAIVRLAEVYAWLDFGASERFFEYADRARAFTDSLPVRYRMVQQGLNSLNDLTPAGVQTLRDATWMYPDDPDAWFLLAETYMHIGEPTQATREDVWRALSRAVELDPDFAPALIHYAEQAVLMGDSALARRTVDRFEELTGSRALLQHVDLAIDIVLGDSTAAAAAVERARTMPLETYEYYHGAISIWHERLDRQVPLLTAFNSRMGGDLDQVIAQHYAAIGQLDQGARFVAASSLTPARRALWWAYVWTIWDTPPPAPDDPGGDITVDSCDTPAFDASCHIFVGVAAAAWRRADLNRHAIEHLRDVATTARDTAPRDAELWSNYADIAEGAWLWRNGDAERGRGLLEAYVTRGHGAYENWDGDRARIELAFLAMQQRRHADAIPYFRAESLFGWDRAAALLGLARAHAALGQHEQAREYYGRFASLTSTGDDLPAIREARDAIAR